MDKMAALMEKNLQLLLENVEELTDEELEEETLEEYRTVQGASEAALEDFEARFQIRLPEDFRALLLLQALPQLSAQGQHPVHVVVGHDVHRVGVCGNAGVPHHRAAVG